MQEPPLVLVAIGAFWPGNEASGPNQSFRAMVQALGDRFRFRLLARDRPFGANAPSAEAALPNGHYFAPGLRGRRQTIALVRQLQPAILWLNGFFDRDFTLPLLLAKRAGLLGPVRILLSPRGEFNAGALALKPKRKRAFIAGSQRVGLLNGVTFHATNADEGETIRKQFPFHSAPLVSPNIRTLPKLVLRGERDGNAPLRLAFVGRITPVKNLLFGLDVLARVKVPIAFDLYGPIEDAAYWERCRRTIQRLPANISVGHHGAVAHDAVARHLAKADLLFLPTSGENFGHAIFEALAAGTPVLVSERTPWRDLATSQAGWDLPLDQPNAFAATIEHFAAMDETGRMAWRTGARALVEQYAAGTGAARMTEAMLRQVVGTA